MIAVSFDSTPDCTSVGYQRGWVLAGWITTQKTRWSDSGSENYIWLVQELGLIYCHLEKGFQ